MRDAPGASYEHRQSATWVIALLLFAAAFTAALGLLGGAGTRPVSVMALVFLAVAWLFNGLTVRVTDETVSAAFGPGLIARRIPLRDVEDARVVRNHWWYGWGIRLTPHGWLFNIAGLDAVEVTFRGGKHFRIGTDEPEALVDAIQARLPRSAGA